LKTDTTIVSLDLSLNNMVLGLDALIEGLSQNSTIVTLRLRNNNIDGRKNQNQLFNLVYGHPSLTCIDVGNFDTIKNRNRIHNEGLTAIVEGIVKSVETTGQSLISQIQLQQSSLTGEGMVNFLKFSSVKQYVDIQILDLSNNELGPETPIFLEELIDSLIQLNLAGTKLGSKGAYQFAKLLRAEAEAKKCNRGKLRYLDISNNNIGTNGLQKIVGRLKKSQTLVNLNVSGNDFGERPENFNQIENILAKSRSL
jgi:Ran GTPase-activating protein (RanGAP) involved in mRNA processing and transport